MPINKLDKLKKIPSQTRVFGQHRGIVYDHCRYF